MQYRVEMRDAKGQLLSEDWHVSKADAEEFRDELLQEADELYETFVTVEIFEEA